LRAFGWQGGERPARSEFARRHALYEMLDRDFRTQTRFFAAAAWTNRMFASLFESGPSWVSAGTHAFLNKLGAELEDVNRRFAADLRHETVEGANLDTRLVTAEQRVVQAHLDCARVRIARWPRISIELNQLLNGTHIAARAAPLLLHSRRYRAVLGEARRQMGGGLDFAEESHRVTIGCALIRHLRRG
jgi:hypothetical protein